MKYPIELLCPITGQVFHDPVVAADGITYERAAVAGHIARYGTSPKTGATLSSSNLRPDVSMRSRVRGYKASRQPTVDELGRMLNESLTTDRERWSVVASEYGGQVALRCLDPERVLNGQLIAAALDEVAEGRPVCLLVDTHKNAPERCLVESMTLHAEGESIKATVVVLPASVLSKENRAFVKTGQHSMPRVHRALAQFRRKTLRVTMRTAGTLCFVLQVPAWVATPVVYPIMRMMRPERAAGGTAADASSSEGTGWRFSPLAAVGLMLWAIPLGPVSGPTHLMGRQMEPWLAQGHASA